MINTGKFGNVHQDKGMAMYRGNGVEGLIKVRPKRPLRKRYEICLVEELPSHDDVHQIRTVVGTAFQQTDGSIRAVLKPGISISGSLDFVPVSDDA